MITYNHAAFVKQAIDSVLTQETNFTVELVIGEDCSTDGTRAIVQDYARRYPNVIRTLLPERNLGALGNNVATLMECKGEYVAMLEGDDYWTCAHKLQRQVDYLENFPECALCFHDSDVEECHSGGGTGSHRPFYSKLPPERLGFDDFAGGFYPHTAACVIVNDRAALRPVFEGQLFGYALTIFDCVLVAGRQAGFIGTKMSVYRVHSGGIYSAVSNERQLLMANHGLLAAWRHFSQQNKGALFAERIMNNYLQLAGIYRRQRQLAPCVTNYLKAWHLLCFPPNLAGLAGFGQRHWGFLAKVFRCTR